MHLRQALNGQIEGQAELTAVDKPSRFSKKSRKCQGSQP